MKTVERTVVFGLALAAMLPVATFATDYTWDAGGDKTNWFDAANWDPDGLPAGGDAVIITNTAKPLLTNSTAYLGSFTITNATLTFSNWVTTLQASNVFILNGGRLTHAVCNTNVAPGNTNRIHVMCSNLTVEAGGRISANANGFPYTSDRGCGPGGGVRGSYEGGGGYGGRGGGDGGGNTYGSVAEPLDPGSAGYTYSSSYGGSGGGAIRIEAVGLVTVNGEITSTGGNSESAFGGAVGGGGSGGSIYLSCNAIAGAGRINADGGDSRANGFTWRPSGGGGGRIALIYDPAAQSNETVTPTISAAGGGCLEYSTTAPVYGYPGTIYMTNTSLLGTNLGGGQYSIPGWTNWTTGNLNLTNGMVVFPAGFDLHVLTDVVAQADGTLEFSNMTAQIDGKWEQTTVKQAVSAAIYGGAQSRTIVGGDLTLNGDIRFQFSALTNEGMALNIGGALTLTNKAEMRVYGAPCYAADADYGAVVGVTNRFSVATGSWVHAYCYGNSGTGVLFRVGSLLVMTNGGFNAVGLGYPGEIGPGKGSDSGGGADVGGGGGGYGGRGGNGKWWPTSGAGGPPYGNSNAPVLAGSGGGGYLGSGGGAGGGVIRIEASNGDVRVDGMLTANGGTGGSAYGGGGSGGAIYLICRMLYGNGLLSANGGARGPIAAGGGGGGRIAVLTTSHPWDESLPPMPTMQVFSNVNSYGTASNGTVVLIVDPNAPRIENNWATNITAASADLVGNLTSTGGADTTVMVFWGKTNGLDVKEDWATNATIGVLEPGPVTNSIASLDGATLYYYRFYATNSMGEDWATPSAVFSTAGPPDVNNGDGATNITLTSAILRGFAQGTPHPTVTIHWGVTDGETNWPAWTNHIAMGEIADTAFESQISGLLANQTYYYRCYATNDYGDVWASSTTNFFTGVPAISIADAQVEKGILGTTTDAVFAVALSATSAVDVTVEYSASNGTATAGVEFYGTNGTLTIAGGSIAGSITVVVIGNDTDQFPSRNFFVNLANPTNAVWGDAQALGTIVDTDRVAEVRTWTGTGNWWANPTNWDPEGIPGPLDTAIIQSGTSILSTSAAVTALVVSNGATLLFTNWDTSLRATSATVGDGGVIAHAPQSATTTNAFGQWIPDNRIYLICKNLIVNEGGIINANGKGYPYGVSGGYIAGCGPGGGPAAWGSVRGGGYGGAGAGGGAPGAYGGPGGPIYGSMTAPLDPGSSGGSQGVNYGGAGGGVISIELADAGTIDGGISANGGSGVGMGGGGSGGSVYIAGGVLRGSGRITADGGDAAPSSDINFPPNGGGGGRIALIYDPVAQSNETETPFISAAGGAGSAWSTIAPLYGYPGTVFMTNTSLLNTNLGGGQLFIPDWTSWTVGNLSLTNGMVVFPASFGSLHVLTNVAAQADGALELSNMNTQVDGNWIQANTRQAVPAAIYGGAQSRTVIGGDLTLNGDIRFKFNALTNEGMALNIGGALTLTNKAEMRVYGAPRYATNTDYGAVIGVTGEVVVTTGCWVYAHCYGSSGTGVLFRMGSLNVLSNGGFNADGLGYPGIANSGGIGPGGGTIGPGGTGGGGGGGYGGRGGDGQGTAIYGGQTYGNSNAPILGGSSGGTYSGGGAPGGSGGGVIRLDVGNGAARIDGTLTAKGGTGGNPYGAGGSGGSIYLICRSFNGGGLLTACGGGRVSAAAGGGGGGRIAVWCGLSENQKARALAGDFARMLVATNNKYFSGTFLVTNGLGYTNLPPGGAEAGTIFFITPLPSGAAFSIR